MKNPVDGFSVGLADDNNIYEWHCMMEGPPDSDYEGGYFPCSLSFPKEYPNKPPVMKFLTPGFWHPNVYKYGQHAAEPVPPTLPRYVLLPAPHWRLVSVMS